MPLWIIELGYFSLAIIMICVTLGFVIATVGIFISVYKQWKGYK